MLKLRYIGTSSIPIECECITPDNLADKSLAQIGALPVQHGNAQAPLGEFFHLEGDAADRELLMDGDCSRVKRVGASMASGKISIRGPIGMHLGAAMTGGEIHVHGAAGDWVGAEMRGGRIHVRGDSGHFVGAGYRGSRLGMRGGAILIEGKAGSDIGSGMRRGIIAIGSETGDFPGAGMIAGSIFLFGKSGNRIGAGMKRGTIVMTDGPTPLLPTFRYDCIYKPVFLDLYWKRLQGWNYPVPDNRHGLWKRYSGDFVAAGKGELLFWEHT